LARAPPHPPLREGPPADVEQLLAPFLAGHPLSVGFGGLFGHRNIIALCRRLVSTGYRFDAALGHRSETARRVRRALGLEPGLFRPADIVGPAKLLEPPDYPGGLV